MKRFWKKFFHWQVLLGLLLLSLSLAFYGLHYLIFQDLHHIFLYLIGDIAFVFIEVLMVTLIIHRLLSVREKQSLLKKMNMVIGVFFIEVGTGLLKMLSGFDADAASVGEMLSLSAQCSTRDFARLHKRTGAHPCRIEIKRGNLANLREVLGGKRAFLLELLQNPNLLEHESFTELLWSVFHLAEELHCRPDLKLLPESDCQHLAKDAQRAYRLLLWAWLDYMKHLRQDYPYLFSLALRTNPFDPRASVIVQD